MKPATRHIMLSLGKSAPGDGGIFEFSSQLAQRFAAVAPEWAERDQVRADNDKTVARLYGMTDAEFAHLLRSFKGMATKRPEYLALLQ